MEDFAYDLGDQVMNGHLGGSEAASIISKRYPMLGSESINHILSQACYFSRK
jgi:hypothetical protein